MILRLWWFSSSISLGDFLTPISNILINISYCNTYIQFVFFIKPPPLIFYWEISKILKAAILQNTREQLLLLVQLKLLQSVFVNLCFIKFFPIKWKQEAPQSWSHTNFDSLGSTFPKMASPVQNRNYEYHHRILPKYQISDLKDNFVFADQKVCLQWNHWVQHIRIFLGTTFQFQQVIKNFWIKSANKQVSC